MRLEAEILKLGKNINESKSHLLDQLDSIGKMLRGLYKSLSKR